MLGIGALGSEPRHRLTIAFSTDTKNLIEGGTLPVKDQAEGALGHTVVAGKSQSFDHPEAYLFRELVSINSASISAFRIVLLLWIGGTVENISPDINSPLTAESRVHLGGRMGLGPGRGILDMPQLDGLR